MNAKVPSHWLAGISRPANREGAVGIEMRSRESRWLGQLMRLRCQGIIAAQSAVRVAFNPKNLALCRLVMLP